MTIRHVVVVMLENRSYDNILGALKGTPAPQSNPLGIAPGSPLIPNANQVMPTQVNGSGPEFPPTTIPITDPKETFNDMAQQIIGLTAVPTGGQPYATYPPTTAALQDALMQGFVNNYATKLNDSPNVGDVMNYFTPGQLPVTSFLANNYAVCDQWFASVPTQTYTNRAFALTGAPAVAVVTGSTQPYSLIDDAQYVVDELQDTSSICEELDSVFAREKGPFWKVYFHDYSIAMQTVNYVATKAAASDNVNVATFDGSDWGSTVPPGLGTLPSTFIEDAAAGTLPRFSFIEPRYGHTSALYGTPLNVFPPNSNHPGGVDSLAPVGGLNSTLFPDIQPGVPNPPIDVASGELFLMRVYNALRSNDAAWRETLLIITYDEHGGLYDHVPPPAGAKPPAKSYPSNISIPPASDKGDVVADRFNYTVFGGRVPAIIVSPWIAPGTVIHPQNGTPFDHTSIIKTVWDLIIPSTTPPRVPASLTDRDAAAPSLAGALSYVAPTPLGQPEQGGNSTGAFTGTILTSPGALVFRKSDNPVSQVILASAPGETLTATLTSTASWVSISQQTVSGVLQVTVTTDSSGLHHRDSPYTTSVQISGSGVSNSPVTIPVTLIIPLF
jgi:phospholipase C